MEPLTKRDDIQPIILGGDWSTYSIARQFFEAFGVSSYCVAEGTIAVIQHSKFIQLYQTPSFSQDDVLGAIASLAQKHAGQHVVLMANTDDRVALVEAIRDKLPQNVVFQFAPRELSDMVSDKIKFQELCQKYGLDVPRTEIVKPAASEAIPPTEVPFPLVAKPAVSAEYAHLFAKGFQKVYFMQEQAQLDKLWADLRAEGFQGEFLVQELIPGDDTYMDSMTMYVGNNGKVGMLSGAHVLLEDHVPLLFGNPVAMITKQYPDLWEKLGHMLEDIGWRGFANIDLKRDPRDGRRVFMDFNPRIGANSYYSAAAGINPMYVLVRDIVDHDPVPKQAIQKSVLYKRVPVSLVRHYIRDAELLKWFDQVVSSGEVYNPTRCPSDSVASRFYGMLMERNYIRKFKEHYPEPTDTSF